jgi:hypothetical protein
MTITNTQFHTNLRHAAQFYVNGTTINRSEKNRHFATPYFVTVKNTPQGLKDWNVIKSVMSPGFHIKLRGRNPNRGQFKTGNEHGKVGGRGGIHQDCPIGVSTSFDVYLTPKKSLGVFISGN